MTANAAPQETVYPQYDRLIEVLDKAKEQFRSRALKLQAEYMHSIGLEARYVEREIRNLKQEVEYYLRLHEAEVDAPRHDSDDRVLGDTVRPYVEDYVGEIEPFEILVEDPKWEDDPEFPWLLKRAILDWAQTGDLYLSETSAK